MIFKFLFLQGYNSLSAWTRDFYNLHFQIIQSISTVLHWVKASVCQQRTVTECILNLLDPLNYLGGGAIIIFIDLVSTNILLSMLGFLLSQKRHADFCFKPSGLFLFSSALRSHLLCESTRVVNDFCLNCSKLQNTQTLLSIAQYKLFYQAPCKSRMVTLTLII